VDSTSKRLGIDLLRMTPEDAIRRSDRDKLVKTGYLKKLVG
jgi:hypothetical protein